MAKGRNDKHLVGKTVYAALSNSYLYFGRTCISLVNPVVPDNLLLALALGLQSQIE